MKNFLTAGIAICFGFWTAPASAQVLVPAREWTSSDGKTMLAELLRFDGANARFRLKNGNVHEVLDDRFSRKDQATLLKARFDSDFRRSYSDVLNANFFYSKHLAEDDWIGRCYAYIGSDADSVWLRFTMYPRAQTLSEAVAILLVGAGPQVRLEYESGEVDSGRGKKGAWENVDISLSKLADQVLPLLEASDEFGVFLEDEAGAKYPFVLTREEQAAFRDVAAHYRKIADLASDKAWWTAFRVLKPGEKDEPENGAVAQADPLARFRDPDRAAVIPSRPWTNALDQTLEAAVIGFNGGAVVLRETGGDLREVPLTGFVDEDQHLLLKTRLDGTFERSVHPIDDGLQYYWPASWGLDQTSHQGLILAIDPQTKEPHLILQSYTGKLGGEKLARTLFRGDQMDREIEISMAQQISLQSDPDTWGWLSLTGDALEAVLPLAESKAIYFRLFASDDREDNGAFRSNEVRATQEAIALYQWLEMVSLPEVKTPVPGE